MVTLKIGKTEIPYLVREGQRTKRRHVVVTPEQIEVVVPVGQMNTAVDFIQSRKQWVFEKWTEMQAAADRQDTVGTGRLVSGAKILYRGRRLKLTIVPTDGPLRVEYRSAFILHRPEGTTDEDLQNALNRWFKGRVRADTEETIKRVSTKLSVRPTAIRVLDLKHIWGSCGEGGVIHLNWRLVHAPKPVLEYAVVHELCHLVHRNHSPAFWSLVEELLPDYQDRKQWLERNETLIEGVKKGEGL